MAVSRLRLLLVHAALALLVLPAACDRKAPEPAPAPPRATAAPPAAAVPAALSERLSRPAPARLVAIGDLHGDLEVTRKALRLAGAIDAGGKWVGGKLVVVQTGDMIDRGDGDRAILDLLGRLRGEAKQAGGDVLLLSGNHELMNVASDFRYVTPGGFTTFVDVRPTGPKAPMLAELEPAKRGRTAAFVPGGPYAAMIADWPIMMKVGDSVFVHGGILPKHVAYGLDRMNDEVRAWVLDKRPEPPAVVVAEDGPVWTRGYSSSPSEQDCARLGKALSMLGARRMVVGHTPQKEGISPACGDRVWRIDVGLARYYGGPLQVLQIEGDQVKVLKQEG
jgi:hypothetical protein